MSQNYIDSEGEEDHGDFGDDDEEGFAIGKVVFPVDHQKDFIDPEAVLIDHADQYIGKYVGQYLSEKVIGSTLKGLHGEESEDEFEGEGDEGGGGPKFWKVLGTLQDKRLDVPQFLWATMRADDQEAYIKELMKCSVVVYDITHDPSPERFAEVRSIVDALRARTPTFKTRRVFILISSLHSWSHTPLPDPENPEVYFDESLYRYRRTQPQYRELQLLERYVVASGKMTRGMLKAYVIGAGAVYGEEELALHHYFKAAWHNTKYLPIYGTGKNYFPTIYIKDLASIIQHIMDLTPKRQRYIIAVDPVISQQDQVAKAISDVLGNGRVKRLPQEDIYLNRELTPFQADQHLLDLRIETSFCQQNFNIEWTAEDGLASIKRKLADEFRKARDLTPLKILLVGPPGSGKSTAARQISDMYRLHHFTKAEMIESTKELLRTVAGEEPELEIEGVNIAAEEAIRERARALLAEVDQCQEENHGELTDEIVIKLYRYRLLTNPCQNQGFILDGFPNTYETAKALFRAGEENGEFDPGDEDEDEMMMGEDEDGSRPRMDPRLLPDRVFVFEAPEEFIRARLGTVPLSQIEDRHLERSISKEFQIYRDLSAEYEKSLQAFLDEQELVYFPIDISSDESPMMEGTVKYMSGVIGRAHNYGITREEEDALRTAQYLEQSVLEAKEREELAILESQEIEERRKNIQQWMEKLAKIKKEEFEREEAALIPLRNYLMAHIIPTLTRGLIDVTRARPDDPIDFLAEFLFQNNPGGINPFGDHYLKQ